MGPHRRRRTGYYNLWIACTDPFTSAPPPSSAKAEFLDGQESSMPRKLTRSMSDNTTRTRPVLTTDTQSNAHECSLDLTDTHCTRKSSTTVGSPQSLSTQSLREQAWLSGQPRAKLSSAGADSASDGWRDGDEATICRSASDWSRSVSKSYKTHSTIYHIYHTGDRTDNFSIHLVPDKEIPLPQVDDPSAPNYVDDEKLRRRKPSLLSRTSTLFAPSKTAKDPVNKCGRFVKRCRTIDKPEFDARTETSPYYVHTPYVFGHLPPRTLRRGGNRRSPTLCLMEHAWFWRHFDIHFSDALTRDDVVDGRGVVTARYGTKNGKDGTFKGYELSKRRFWLESGKKFHLAEIQKMRECRTRGTEAGQECGCAKHAVKAATPLKPDESVRMKWISPFREPRTYHFRYLGVDFYWKGTATVKDKKFWGIFLTWNHLKLIAVTPPWIEDKQGAESTQPSKEICLAKYTSLAAHRKAGRLEVFDNDVKRFLAEHVKSDIETTKKEDRFPSESMEDGDHYTRLNDIIMATTMGMIIGEEQKRDVLKETLSAIFEGVENGGGG
ncbi:MAG: hypothetical protein M1833_005250 [Piccolia ochrophora]|nr:MAG: hypothetical protein M1833_005250 [Piccolia ochrophora]